MSARAIRDTACPAARRDRSLRPALLCSAVLACLMPASAATARSDPALRDRDLPCNDLCRAWMSWEPEHEATDGVRSEPHAEEPGIAARHGGVVAAVPRPSPAVRTRRTSASARRESLEARRLARAEDASAPLNKPSLPRSVPPRRPSALVSTPVGAVEVADDGGSRRPDQPAADADAPRDGAVGRLRSDVDPADAAVLARPLYRPSDVTVAPQDRPETSGGPFGGEAEPRAPGPVTTAMAVRRDDQTATDASSPPASASSAPHTASVDAALPATDPVPPAPATIDPKSTTQLSAGPSAVAGSRHGTALVNAVSAPVLPASDLERLDDPERRGPSVAVAPTSTPPRPTFGALLLGGLAVLSLVGVRRRTGLGDPT